MTSQVFVAAALTRDFGGVFLTQHLHGSAGAQLSGS